MASPSSSVCSPTKFLRRHAARHPPASVETTPWRRRAGCFKTARCLFYGIVPKKKETRERFTDMSLNWSGNVMCDGSAYNSPSQE